MDELDLILWLFLMIGSAGVLAAFLFYGGAFLIQRTKLLWLDIELKRAEVAAQNVGVNLLQADVQSRLVDVNLKHEIIRPDENGLLPVSRAMIDGGAITEVVLAAIHAFIEVQRPAANVPHSLTYAPHIKNDKLAVVDDSPAQLEAHTMVAKDFFQLYESGALPINKFLIGFDLEDKQPVIAGWSSLYSALIGGQSGSGKSTLIRNVLAQSALQGGRFAILDPHFASGDESLGASLMPLRKQMLFDVASNDNEIVQAIKYVADVGKRRLIGKDTDRTPLVLIVDETTALLSRGNVAPDLLELLEMIAQETRKVGVYAMCIGQQFSAETMKTTARNSFVSMLSCRARRDVARTQSGNIQFARLAETLTVGQAVWMAPSGEVKRLAIPNTTQRHLEAVGERLSGTKDGPEKWFIHEETTCEHRVDVNHLYGADKPVANQLEAGVEINIKSMRALEMFREGHNIKEIIAAVYGATTGAPYTKAVAEFTELLRSQLGGTQ